MMAFLKSSLTMLTMLVLIQPRDHGATKQGKVSAMPYPNRTVQHFVVRDGSVLGGILGLGVKSNIPMGLVLADRRLCGNHLNVDLRNKSVAEILDRLTKSYAYRWRLEGSLIIIEPNYVPQQMKQLLQLKLPHYAAPAATSQEQNVYLWTTTRGVLKPGEGTATNILSSPNALTFPALDLTNATVGNVLGQLSLRANGIWILYPFGKKLSDAATAPFSNVVSYAEVEKIGALNCDWPGGP